MSGGGARIFVDQATQDWSSEDPFAVEVGNCGVAIVVFAVGDALGDALMRPGRGRDPSCWISLSWPWA